MTDKVAGPDGSRLSEGLGAVFTEAVLNAATMTELQAMRAARRYCPKCQEQKLRHTGAGGIGMVFMICAGCGTTVVVGA